MNNNSIHQIYMGQWLPDLQNKQALDVKILTASTVGGMILLFALDVGMDLLASTGDVFNKNVYLVALLALTPTVVCDVIMDIIQLHNINSRIAL